jgi:hypothetical protein
VIPVARKVRQRAATFAAAPLERVAELLETQGKRHTPESVTEDKPAGSQLGLKRNALFMLQS